MDLLCVGMYRACSTWQYEVAAHLIETHRAGVRLGYLTSEQYGTLPRVGPGRNNPGWRVLKCHEGGPAFDRALAGGRALALYAYRDVRDVVDSMLHKRGLDFETFLARGMVHQILANDRHWKRRPGRLDQRYESLIADPTAGVAQIARHLGIAIGPGEALAVAADYSLEANRRRTQAVAARLAATGVDLADPANRERADEQTLLHWNHVREGRVGGWRAHAAPRQRRVVQSLSARWLRDHGYEPDTLGRVGFRDSIRDRAITVRGALACRLRRCSLRFPRLARVVKQALGLPVDPLPVPDSTPANIRPRLQRDRKSQVS